MNNLALNTTSVPINTPKNDVYIKLIDAVKERPEIFICPIALIGFALIASKYIDAKYDRETTISCTPNKGFSYVSKSVTINNATICSK